MTNEERYKKIDELSNIFGFELPIDFWITTFFNKPSINITALNNLFAKHDPEYHPASFAYRGEANVSMMDYIEKKYGKEILETFKQIM